jgi:hypothetical protein
VGAFPKKTDKMHRSLRSIGLLCCLCPSSTCHLVYFFSTFGMATYDGHNIV